MERVFKRKPSSVLWEASVPCLVWLMSEVLACKSARPFIYCCGSTLVIRTLSSHLLHSLTTGCFRQRCSPQAPWRPPSLHCLASSVCLSTPWLPLEFTRPPSPASHGGHSVGSMSLTIALARAHWPVYVKTLWTPQGQLTSDQGQSSCINSARGSSSIQWSWLCGVWN